MPKVGRREYKSEKKDTKKHLSDKQASLSYINLHISKSLSANTYSQAKLTFLSLNFCIYSLLIAGLP